MSDIERDETQAPATTPVANAATSSAATPTTQRKPYELLSLAQMEGLRPPEYLIEGILPDRGISVLYGAPGSGKSFLALDWALSLARGEGWAGRGIKRGLVIYVAAEGAYGYPPRIRAWHEANEVAQDDTAPFIYFLDEPVHLGDASDGKTDLDRFIAAIEEVRGRPALAEMRPSLIVFDTLSRCLAGEDENSTKALSAVVSKVENLARSYDCAVLLVHHTRKKDDEIRGSGVLAGAANMMGSVKQYKSRKTVELRCTKMKDGPEFDGIDFKFAPMSVSTVLTVVAADIKAVDDDEGDELRENQRWMLAALRDGMTMAQWIEAAAKIATDNGEALNPKTGTRIGAELITLNYVSRRRIGREYRYYCIPVSSAEPENKNDEKNSKVT